MQNNKEGSKMASEISNIRGQAPDVARDPKVIRKNEELLVIMRAYIQQAERFAETGDWDAELEMLHIRQYDIPAALKACRKAAEKFYKKYPDGIASE
jgi:uncharacterized protein YdeI (YjbR/CyaY-like superfamily)